MDPLDPLTEIINTGQASSYFIEVERFLWAMIGFFFLGAISTSITKAMKQNDLLGNKSFLSILKATKREDKISKNITDEDK